MESTQKAIYNSLRMSWLQDKTIMIEPWKVEDLRPLSLDVLFSRLQKKEIFLDRASFVSYADQFDSPEELSEWLRESVNLEEEEADEIFLLVFELWRRLVP